MLSDEFIAKVRLIFENFTEISSLNEYLKQKTGILEFFPSFQELEEFKQFMNNPAPISERTKDLGDFQTPSHLTDKICQYLADSGFKPNIIIEPTCGIGNFVISSLKILSNWLRLGVD